MKNSIIKSSLIGLVLLLSVSSCKNQDIGPGGAGWLIPESEVHDGGPGKDGIPSVDNPSFEAVSTISFLDDDDLMVVVRNDSQIKAYSHDVLDWHEIINDKIAGKAISITYCPLTGTAIGWDRTINGKETTFGVSGLLYNSNLIPYDRKTNSNWSQIRLDCVNGELQSTQVQTFEVLETTWKTVRTLFPGAQILNLETGFSRSYGSYPYGGYRTNESLIFPVSPDDTRLPRKERVRGVIHDGSAKVYRFSNFEDPELDVIQDQYKGIKLVLAGSTTQNFIVAFNRELDGTLLEFTNLKNSGELIMQDTEGNKWNIWGEAVEGPRQGQVLDRVESFLGYWFSWGAFYPGAEIHEN